MSKGILVIDIPKCCYDCPFLFEWGFYGCLACENKELNENEYDKQRADWCPIKEISTEDEQKNIGGNV